MGETVLLLRHQNDPVPIPEEQREAVAL